MVPYVFWGEVVAFSNFLVQLFDIGKSRDKTEGATVRLLAVEHKLRLLRAVVVVHSVGRRSHFLGRHGRQRRRRVFRRFLLKQRHRNICNPALSNGC